MRPRRLLGVGWVDCVWISLRLFEQRADALGKVRAAEIGGTALHPVSRIFKEVQNAHNAYFPLVSLAEDEVGNGEGERRETQNDQCGLHCFFAPKNALS
ncbi:hypothetical protein [Phyllobacterium zundukense]|uniref:hypothetical protein n=1 Tax=Phyllobacterium zundukense TaxID=1867719 RepID=UPI0010542F0F|nr:hypothetical protein [Phyllobacterium zundukense]